MPNHKRLTLTAGVALLFPGFWIPTCTAQASAQYTITVGELDNRLARVQARLPLKDSVILMSPEGASHLTDGWATFIRSLMAKNDAGIAIPLQYLGHARWKIPDPLSQRINLSYEVLLEHDQRRWPFGYDEAAYAKSDCVFYTGASLFIGAFDLENIAVQFNVPPGWRVSVPWKDAGKWNAKKYTIDDLTRVANLAAGADVSSFFKKYVEGTNVIPLESYLGDLGLQIIRETNEDGTHRVIRKETGMTSSQQAMLSKVLTR